MRFLSTTFALKRLFCWFFPGRIFGSSFFCSLFSRGTARFLASLFCSYFLSCHIYALQKNQEAGIIQIERQRGSTRRHKPLVFYIVSAKPEVFELTRISSAITVVCIPPLTLNFAVNRINLGCKASSRSLNILLVTASW